tara:strand:+ start:12906 stop:13124 length:219 start_codon:yes stop_codon:yes gene_type:complete
VQDTEKANFCDFFKVNPKAYNKKDGAAEKAAKASLAELFGEEVEPDTEITTSPTEEADKALAELKRLFDKDL